jgi:3-hydroxyisobutyrate dehydrogenase
VNQILVSVTNMAVSEALTFARRNGLDLEKTITAVAGGAAGSWQLANLGPKMAAGDFRPGFAIDLQQKDLKLVLAAALEARTSVPAASLVHQLFTAAQAAGRGKDGTQALFTVLEKLSGS